MKSSLLWPSSWRLDRGTRSPYGFQCINVDISIGTEICLKISAWVEEYIIKIYILTDSSGNVNSLLASQIIMLPSRLLSQLLHAPL